MQDRSTGFPDLIASDLEELESSVLRRTRRITQSACSPVVEVDGRYVVAFASNDYLGLANAPELIEAAKQATERWGVGSGASHLVSGHTQAHERLESHLAEFVGCEKAISFSTGYMANIAVLPALLGRGDEIFADKINHASLVDGALLSRATLTRYPHLDSIGPGAQTGDVHGTSQSDRDRCRIQHGWRHCATLGITRFGGKS